MYFLQSDFQSSKVNHLKKLESKDSRWETDEVCHYYVHIQVKRKEAQGREP